MSNIKKIIAVVLALVMALSVATIAFAAEGDAYSVTVTADKTELQAGESATVTVKVTANFNVSAMSIPVFFDNTKVTASAGATTLEHATIVTETSPDVDKYFEGVDHTKDDYGVRAVVYIAPYGAEISSYTNATVMTFTVTANDDATGAVVLECISTSVKTSSNPSGALYIAKNSSKTATVDSLPEVIDEANITGATTTINIAGGEVEANTLVVKDSFENADDVKIDKEIIGVYLDWYEDEYADAVDADATGLVYGADVFEFVLEDVLTTTLGDDYLRLTRTDEADGYDSTGTKIEVLAADGQTVLETYYYVYFGDINCDGIIDTGDATVCITTVKKNLSCDSIAQFIAADYNADTFIDTGDITGLVKSVKRDETADQGELAANLYAEYQSQL